MKTSDLIVRCYAEQEKDGSWFAMCIDLNLYACGNTDQEAIGKLHNFVKDYVSEALTVDAEYIENLVPRPAPIGFRVKYHMISMLCRFQRAAKKCTSIKFKDHLPVVPA